MAIMRCVGFQPHQEMTVDEFKGWLRRYDSNNDGQISHDELKEALRALKTRYSWWKSRQAIKEADSNHDGLIDISNEIEKLVHYAQTRLHLKIHDWWTFPVLSWFRMFCDVWIEVV